MPMQTNSVIQRTRDLSFSQLDDDLLAIDAQAGYYYALNESAGRIWDLIAKPVTVGTVCEQLRREYAVNPDECERTVLTLLQSLHKAGLVKVKG